MADQPQPDPPQPPYFDSAAGTWVLSRYADVVAAMQHPHLWAVGGGSRQIDHASRDEIGRLKARSEVLSQFSPSHLAKWRSLMDDEARRILASLPAGQPVELLRQFALPWGLTLAIRATGASPADRELLGALSTRVFAATVTTGDSPSHADASAATGELRRALAACPTVMVEPTFVAFSQTTPRLLLNSWLALIAHPDQFATLRARPELIAAAVEELLRYAGIVRRVFRRATGIAEIGGVTIAEGQLVVLMLASANRDPVQFPNPNRLDVTRPISSHVSLGNGRNACVGAAPIRAAFYFATTALVSMFSAAELQGIGEWRIGSGFWFPSSVEVILT